MSTFGDALKLARRSAGKKLRDTSTVANVSLSYMSDIESGYRNPPEPEIVAGLEAYLGVASGSLEALAAEIRKRRPTDIAQTIKGNTKLSELFFRVRDLPEEEIKKIIDQLDDEE